jgi:hypothetical protein
MVLFEATSRSAEGHTTAPAHRQTEYGQNPDYDALDFCSNLDNGLPDAWSGHEELESDE